MGSFTDSIQTTLSHNGVAISALPTRLLGALTADSSISATRWRILSGFTTTTLPAAASQIGGPFCRVFPRVILTVLASTQKDTFGIAVSTVDVLCVSPPTGTSIVLLKCPCRTLPPAH